MVGLQKVILAAALFLGGVGLVGAQELSFLSAADSRPVLSAKDAFFIRLSPFDRAARLKTDHGVSEAQFVEYVASSALDWNQNEKSKVETAFQKAQAEATRLSLLLPNRIYLIKTSGREEGDAAYTRGSAIVIPKSMLASSGRELQKLLAHELFHISTRTNPKLARLLYETIGFHYCGEIEFPAQLAPRKITNPDAPVNDYCIQVVLAGEKVWAMPILFSQSPGYNTARGGEFFDYLQMALVLVERPTASGTSRVLYDSHGPRLVGLGQVSGFFEQVGRNTSYTIHAEEILADNFALLVMGERNVRSPELLVELQSALAKYKPVEQVFPGDAPKAARP
jgi:hypothetical protein